jgi:hypothetical protein
LVFLKFIYSRMQKIIRVGHRFIIREFYYLYEFTILNLLRKSGKQLSFLSNLSRLCFGNFKNLSGKVIPETDRMDFREGETGGGFYR